MSDLLIGPMTAAHGGGDDPPKFSVTRVVGIVVSGLVIGIVLSVVLGWFFVIKPGLKDFPLGPNFGRGLAALSAGMSAPPAADARARSLGIPLGQLTVQELQSGNTGFHWVPGATSSTPLAKDPPVEENVSFTASDQHVITAIQGVTGSCVFGLDLTSSSDPLIVTDGLRGPGQYLVSIETGKLGTPSTCAAINAPTTGWIETTGH